MGAVNLTTEAVKESGHVALDSEEHDDTSFTAVLECQAVSRAMDMESPPLPCLVKADKRSVKPRSANNWVVKTQNRYVAPDLLDDELCDDDECELNSSGSMSRFEKNGNGRVVSNVQFDAPQGGRLEKKVAAGKKASGLEGGLAAMEGDKHIPIGGNRPSFASLSKPFSISLDP